MSRMRKPDAGRRARRGFSAEFKVAAVVLILDEKYADDHGECLEVASLASSSASERCTST